MNHSNADARQDLTVDYQPRNASLARMPLAVPPDSGQATADDLRSLLHRRLRFLCPLLALLYGGGFITHSTSGQMQWGIRTWFFVGLLGITVLVTVLVWSQRSLSLGRLRAIELVLVAILASRIVIRGEVTFWHPDTQRQFQTWRQTGDDFYLRHQLSHCAVFLNFPTAIYILAYGVCIPNTWRRCVVIVAGLWGLSPIIWVVGSLYYDLPDLWWSDPTVRTTYFLLTIAAVLAVYASHRIETFRHAAVQARRLGQYVLKERLGGGGMGEVYLAKHVLLRRPCAVKLIRPERAGDSAMLERFEREVQTTATLTHSNTVQIFDYGHTPDGTFYYVMEYLPGLTLEDLVKKAGPLPSERAVHFLLQLCGALCEAHAVGLIHRDIKPGNVMICERGRTHDVAKLLDFGLVQTHVASDSDDRLTQQGTVIGTPQFMSPEQAGSGDPVDARSDIYSVGALAYFLLTGHPVFTGASPLKTLAAHLYETPAPLKNYRADMPPELDAIIMRCLAKNPSDRFPNVQSLASALADCSTLKQWTEEAAAEWWQSREQLTPPTTSDIGG